MRCSLMLAPHLVSSRKTTKAPACHAEAQGACATAQIGHRCPLAARWGAAAMILTQRLFAGSRRAPVRLATRWEGPPLEERRTRAPPCPSVQPSKDRAAGPVHGGAARSRQPP